jgi:hypothetical protein
MLAHVPVIGSTRRRVLISQGNSSELVQLNRANDISQIIVRGCKLPDLGQDAISAALAE